MRSNLRLVETSEEYMTSVDDVAGSGGENNQPAQEWDKQAYIDRKEFHRILRRECSASEYVVYCYFEDNCRPARNDGWWYSPYDTIAEECNLSRATVIRATAALKEAGLLEVGEEYGRQKKANNYRALLPNSINLKLLQDKYQKDTFNKSQNDTYNEEISIKKKLIPQKKVSKRYPTVLVKDSNYKDSLNTTPNGVAAPPPERVKAVADDELTDWQVAMKHWATLQKTRPKGCDDDWFKLLCRDFPIDRVLAGLTLAKENGSTQVAKQVRKTVENLSQDERACFDGNGKRIKSKGGNGSNGRGPYLGRDGTYPANGNGQLRPLAGGDGDGNGPFIAGVTRPRNDAERELEYQHHLKITREWRLPGT